MKNRSEFKHEPRCDCSGTGIFSTFGMALVSGYDLLDDSDKADGDIDPVYNLYRGPTGAYVQCKSPLDGRFDDTGTEAQQEFELREDLFEEGAWHDDDADGYSDIARAEYAACGCEAPSPVEHDDDYTALAKEYRIVDTVADWAYDQAVHDLISGKARHARNGGPRRGGNRMATCYFTTRRQADIARQEAFKACESWRGISGEAKSVWLAKQTPSSKFDPRKHLPAPRDPFASVGLERPNYRGARIVA